MAFGAKIRLAVDDSNEKAFRADIQRYVNEATESNPIKIKNISFEVNKSEIKKIQTDINGAKGLTVKLKEVDATEAIAKLRNDIQTMLKGLSVVGLKEFIGTEGIDNTAAAISNVKKEAAETQANLKMIKSAASEAAKVLNSVSFGKNAIQDPARLKEITDWANLVIKETQAVEVATDEVTKKIYEEATALSQTAAGYQKQQQAAEKAAAAQQKATEKAIDAIEKEAAAREKRYNDTYKRDMLSEFSKTQRDLESLNARALNDETSKYYNAEAIAAVRREYALLEPQIEAIRNGQRDAYAEESRSLQASLQMLRDKIALLEKEAAEYEGVARREEQWAQSQLGRDWSAAESAYKSLINDVAKDRGSDGRLQTYNTEELEKVNTLYTQLIERVKQLKIEGDKASGVKAQQVQKEIQGLYKLIQLTQQHRKELIEERSAQAKAQQQAVALENSIKAYISANPKAYQTYTAVFDQMISKLQDTGKLSKGTIDDMRSQFSTLQIVARETGNAGNTIFSMLQKGWEKFGGWSLVTRSMMAAMRTIKQMVSAVTELDSAMTELKKVTDLSEESYRKYVQTASQTAQQIGASVSDVVNATADFARIGYNLADSSALAEAALVYKNVGDGINDIGEASESIISTIKAFEQFGVSASNAMNIVDKFNEVGNNFAISSEGIGVALQKSASALAAAGNDLDESIALIAGMNSVVQNPEQVGTALKTLTMYLRAAKTDAEAAGEATDGMASSVSKLRSQLLLLTKGKVDIMIDDTKFKSTYQIMKELSEIWNDLADVDMSNILNLIGGKRNASTITSLITNFKDAEAALESARNAAGSAITENEKYLTSIQGRLDVIQAKFESMAHALIDSDLVKIVLGIASALMSVVEALAKVHAILPIIVTSVAAIKTAVTTKNITNLATRIVGAKDEIIKAGVATKDITTAIAGLGKAQASALISTLKYARATDQLTDEEYEQILTATALKGATEKASLSMTKLVTGFGAIIKANPIGFFLSVASVIASVWQNISDHIQKSKQESIETAHGIMDAWTETQKTVSRNTSTLEGMREEFATLAKGVDKDGERISLTSDQYERYLSLVDQIVSTTPQVVQGWDEKGKAILNYKNVLQEAINIQENLERSARNAYLGGGSDLIEGLGKEYEELLNKISKRGINGVTGILGESLYMSVGTTQESRAAFRQIIENLGMMDAAEYQRIYDETNRQTPLASLPGKYAYDYDKMVAETQKNVRIYTDEKWVKQWLADASNIINLYEHIDQLQIELQKNNTFDAKQISEIQRLVMGVASTYQEMVDIRQQASAYFAEWFEAGINKEAKWAYSLIPDDAKDEFQNRLSEVLDVKATFAENETLATQYAKSFSEVIRSSFVKEIKQMSETMSADEYNQFLDRVPNLYANFFNRADENVAAAVIEYLRSFKQEIIEIGDAAGPTTKDLRALSSVVDDYKESYNILASAQKDMKDGGALSAETLKAMVKALSDEEDLLEFLSIENNLVKLNTEAWVERSENIFSDETDKIENEIKLLQESNSELDKNSEQYKTNSEQIKKNQDLLALYKTLFQQIATESEKVKKNFVDIFDAADSTSSIDKTGKAVANLKDAMESLKKGTALTKEEIVKLAMEYPKLLEQSDLFTDGSVEGQQAMLKSLLEIYDAEYDATVELEINKLKIIETALRDRIKAEADKAEVLTHIALKEAQDNAGYQEWLSGQIEQYNNIEKANYISAKQGELKISESVMNTMLEQASTTASSMDELWSDHSLSIADAYADGCAGALTALNETGIQTAKWIQEEKKEFISLGKVIQGSLTGNVDSVLNDEGLQSGSTGTKGKIDISNFVNKVSGKPAHKSIVEDLFSDINSQLTDEGLMGGGDKSRFVKDHIKKAAKSTGDSIGRMYVDGISDGINLAARENNPSLDVTEFINNVRDKFAKTVSGVIGDASSDTKNDIIEDAKRGLEGTTNEALEALSELAPDEKSIKDWANHELEVTKQRMQALRDELDKNLAAQKNLLELKNIDLTSVYFKEDKTSSSKSSSKKETELYVADIEKHYEAIKKLAKVQDIRGDVERKLSNETDLQSKIELERLLIDVYKQEIEAEVELVAQRKKTIEANAETLRKLGFDVEYFADTNELLIHNQDHLNEIVADNKGKYDDITEATNELRKSTEKLMNTTESLNDSNIEAANSVEELGYSMVASNKNILEYIDTMTANAKQSLTDVSSAYKTLLEAVKGYNEGNKLTVDTFESLLDLGPGYLTYLQAENGELKLNKEAIEELIKKKVENLALSKAMALVDTIHEKREDAAVLNELATATGKLTKATWDYVYASLAAENLDSDLYDAFKAQLDTLKNLSEETQKNISASFDGAAKTTSDAIDEISKKAEKAKQELSDVAGAYRTLIDAVDSYNESGYLSLDTFQQIMDLSPAYIAYLYDESGAINLNRGALEELIAAKVENLALSKAMALVDSIHQYAGDAEALYALATATTVATGATWDLVYARLAAENLDAELNDAFVAQIDAIRNLAATAQAGIGQSFAAVVKETKSSTEATNSFNKAQQEANEDAKKAMKEQLEQQKEILKNEADKKIDALKDQISKFREIVELKKKSLEASKDEREYEEDIADRIKAIADLQSRIDQLSLDDSRQAQAERQSLMEELMQKQKDLADVQGEHAYDSQMDALDELADNYEKEKNAEIERIEKNLAREQKIYDDALDRLENGAGSVYGQIEAMNINAGNSIYNNLTVGWNQATRAVQDYGASVAAVTGAQITIPNNAMSPLYSRVDAAELYHQLGGTNSAALLPAFNAAAGTASGLTSRKLQEVYNGIGGVSNSSNSSFVYEPTISVSINSNGALSGSSANDFGTQVANVAIQQLNDALARKGIGSSTIATLKAL